MIKSKINKKDLLKEIQQRLDLDHGMTTSLKDTDKIYQTIIETLVEQVEDLTTDEKLVVVGLGTFYKKTIKARQGINPKTKEVIQIPETVRITFKKAK